MNKLKSILSHFMIVFDDAGEVKGSSGDLHGEVPKLADGILDYTRQYGEDRISWQPENGVQVAAAIVRYEGLENGFVLVGRSLREVEQNIIKIKLLCETALVAILVISLVAVVFCELLLATGIPNKEKIK
jgi:hypothetical protein